MNKKKPNIVLYTILMIIVFLVITELFIFGYGSGLIVSTIINYPYGELVISEAVFFCLTVIVLLLFKNSYVFTQKREKITKGLFYGLYYIIVSLITISLTLLFMKGYKSGLSIFNLLIGCLFIGLTEEFLCRGFLLNEFLEKFGNTKKGIWYSIVASGIIFGLIHLGNIFSLGQDVLYTITQALVASATGIVYGIIYYKTKNIWSVVILHGLWDFSVFLAQNTPKYSNTETFNTISVVGIIFTILLILAELVLIVPYIKNIDDKPKKSFVVIISIISVFCYFVFTAIQGVTTTNFGDEYKYNNIEIRNYSVTYDNYEDYYIKDSNNNYSFKLEKSNDNELVFTNMNTKYSIKIRCNGLIDYIIVEEDSYYIIAYVDFIDDKNIFLKYIYVMKDNITNDNLFMDSIKNDFKKYMLSDRSELLVINNRANNKSYLGAYSKDYGYYLLVSEDKMAILNRD